MWQHCHFVTGYEAACAQLLGTIRPFQCKHLRRMSVTPHRLFMIINEPRVDGPSKHTKSGVEIGIALSASAIVM